MTSISTEWLFIWWLTILYKANIYKISKERYKKQETMLRQRLTISGLGGCRGGSSGDSDRLTGEREARAELVGSRARSARSCGVRGRSPRKIFWATPFRSSENAPFYYLIFKSNIISKALTVIFKVLNNTKIRQVSPYSFHSCRGIIPVML